MLTTRIGFVRSAFAAAMALIVPLLAAGLASAHEHRTVGNYDIIVGFLNEPAVQEQPNGLELRVSQGSGDSATPVEGLADSLKAEVMYAGQAMPLNLRAAYGEPGSYKADFIPTMDGAYTFHIFGTINDTDVDESFTSGPKTFSEVQSVTSLQFPSNVPAVGSVAQTASSASDTADSARTLDIVGIVAAIVIGGLGLLFGVAGLRAARAARVNGQSVQTGRMPRDAEGSTGIS